MTAGAIIMMIIGIVIIWGGLAGSLYARMVSKRK
ncbi:methionine/alanine import family NSS transporter small subunit [Sinobaca sp. H24]|nr:methionine/alanine import family NSS transporter small subunit [Sinobaca sp. H24]